MYFSFKTFAILGHVLIVLKLRGQILQEFWIDIEKIVLFNKIVALKNEYRSTMYKQIIWKGQNKNLKNINI